MLFLLFRSRGACDIYKQLLSDAVNQLRAMHRAGVMSNNQANQFDRLVKAVEQVKSRPIWTPNTTRQQQAELIEQLKKELNKVIISSHFFILFTYFLFCQDKQHHRKVLLSSSHLNDYNSGFVRKRNSENHVKIC